MDLSQRSDEQILEVVTPIMDNLMEASTEINHAKHVRDFTERAKGVVTKEHLQKVCEQYQREKGFFAKREFVTIFRRPESLIVVWKQWFSKQPGEFLAELILVQQDERYLVEHVRIL